MIPLIQINQGVKLTEF